MQVVTAPPASVYVPLGHKAFADPSESGHLYPSGQNVHRSCRPREKVPIGHAIISCFDVFGQYDPTGQSMQLVAPASAKVPGAQGIDVLVVGHAFPGGQGRH